MVAPIVLFVYNRLEHTRKTVEALQRNDLATESDLFVYADGPKENASDEQIQKIRLVREYVSTITGFKSVHLYFAERNIGCADSIIRGITEVVNKYGRVIVVEDDIVTNRFFLRFLNEGLDFYQEDKRIFTLGATSNGIKIPQNYKYDIYLSHRSVSWGWATWKDRWDLADWNIKEYDIIKNPTANKIRRFNRGGDDEYEMLISQLNGEIDAWDIRWDYCIHQRDGYTVIPTRTFAINNGMDGSGIHCSNYSHKYSPQYDSNTFDISFVSGIQPNPKVLKACKAFFAQPKVSMAEHFKRFRKAVRKFVKRSLIFLNLYQG